MSEFCHHVSCGLSYLRQARIGSRNWAAGRWSRGLVQSILRWVARMDNMLFGWLVG